MGMSNTVPSSDMVTRELGSVAEKATPSTLEAPAAPGEHANRATP